MLLFFTPSFFLVYGTINTVIPEREILAASDGTLVRECRGIVSIDSGLLFEYVLHDASHQAATYVYHLYDVTEDDLYKFVNANGTWRCRSVDETSLPIIDYPIDALSIMRKHMIFTLVCAVCQGAFIGIICAACCATPSKKPPAEAEQLLPAA